MEEESNYNLLTHLKTEEDGALKLIDEYGNVIKRAKSMTNHVYSTNHPRGFNFEQNKM